MSVASLLICNMALFVAAGCAMYQITLEFPYAFSACAFASLHSLLGLIHCIKGAHCESHEVLSISSRIAEIMPLPLMNIEFYLLTGNSLAMAHALFLIPLIADIVTRYVCEEGEDSSTAMLKDLTILGNITSLALLGVNTDKTSYLMMAMAALLSRFGWILLDTYGGIDHHSAVLFFDTVFFALAGLEMGDFFASDTD